MTGNLSSSWETKEKSKESKKVMFSERQRRIIKQHPPKVASKVRERERVLRISRQGAGETERRNERKREKASVCTL